MHACLCRIVYSLTDVCVQWVVSVNVLVLFPFSHENCYFGNETGQLGVYVHVF